MRIGGHVLVTCPLILISPVTSTVNCVFNIEGSIAQPALAHKLLMQMILDLDFPFRPYLFSICHKAFRCFQGMIDNQLIGK